MDLSKSAGTPRGTMGKAYRQGIGPGKEPGKDPLTQSGQAV
jgi:hypothetical protein